MHSLLIALLLSASGQATGRETGGPDATATAKGWIRLSGDLSGTAASPTVPGLTLKAPLASPALTGTPTAPTAAADTNTTQLATTAYVIGQGATAAPLINGTAAAGASTRWAHGDHVHPTDTSRAPVASPTFTGTPGGPSFTASAASGSAAFTQNDGAKHCLNSGCTEYVTSNAGGIPGSQAWQTPSFTNSWVNYATGGVPNAGYYRDAAGIVHIQGAIKNGTLSASAFTLPAGYRPANLLQFIVVSSTAAAIVQIAATGTVTPTPGVNSHFGLDGISFRAEQ